MTIGSAESSYGKMDPGCCGTECWKYYGVTEILLVGLLLVLVVPRVLHFGGAFLLA